MSNRYRVPCADDTVWVARAIARYRPWVIHRRWDQLAGISLPGDNAGAPLVFPSALDAEILRLSDMPTTHWGRRELAECCIPRNPYVYDGELHLMLVFGFAASLAHRLDVVAGRRTGPCSISEHGAGASGRVGHASPASFIKPAGAAADANARAQRLRPRGIDPFGRTR